MIEEIVQINERIDHVKPISCPYCMNGLERVERKWRDLLFNRISLGKEGYKRYRCKSCKKEIVI